MRESLLDALRGLPPGWAVFLTAMLPILELRGAIPFAAVLGVPWPQAFVLAFAGNMVPIVPLLVFMGPISERLRRLPGFGRFFDWLFARTRKKGGVIERYGPIGLALFVGVPLPVTGAWTGAAAAYVFGIPFRRSLPAIAVGVVLAGVVVTLAVQGVIGLGGILGSG